MRVPAFRDSLLIVVFTAFMLPQTSLASPGDCDELLGGNCHPAPVSKPAKRPELALLSVPEAKPKPVKKVPVIAREKTAEKRAESVSASLERLPDANIRAQSDVQEAEKSEVKIYKPAPYPKGIIQPYSLYPPVEIISASEIPVPNLEPAPQIKRVPVATPVHQIAAPLPSAEPRSQKPIRLNTDTDFAAPPQYQPERVVELKSLEEMTGSDTSATHHEPVSPVIAPRRRIEIQVAGLIQGRERLLVSADFRQIETRAENECMAYFRGRPASEESFMNCMGQTVGSLVYATRRSDLIRYFESLMVPQIH